MALDLPVGSYLLPDSYFGMDRIELVSPPGAPEMQWAVRCNGLCLSRSLAWDREPLPSSCLRNAEWYHQHRFATPEEAYQTWQRWQARIGDDGR